MWKDACRMKDVRIEELEFSLRCKEQDLEHTRGEANSSHMQLTDARQRLLATEQQAAAERASLQLRLEMLEGQLRAEAAQLGSAEVRHATLAAARRPLCCIALRVLLCGQHQSTWSPRFFYTCYSIFMGNTLHRETS